MQLEYKETQKEVWYLVNMCCHKNCEKYRPSKNVRGKKYGIENAFVKEIN